MRDFRGYDSFELAALAEAAREIDAGIDAWLARAARELRPIIEPAARRYGGVWPSDYWIGAADLTLTDALAECGGPPWYRSISVSRDHVTHCSDHAALGTIAHEMIHACGFVTPDHGSPFIDVASEIGLVWLPDRPNTAGLFDLADVPKHFRAVLNQIDPMPREPEHDPDPYPHEERDDGSDDDAGPR